MPVAGEGASESGVLRQGISNVDEGNGMKLMIYIYTYDMSINNKNIKYDIFFWGVFWRFEYSKANNNQHLYLSREPGLSGSNQKMVSVSDLSWRVWKISMGCVIPAGGARWLLDSQDNMERWNKSTITFNHLSCLYTPPKFFIAPEKR